MVQVCGGGWGERDGGGWRETEFYLWRGAGRGLNRDRLADHGKSDVGPKGPQCGKGHKGRNQPGTGRPGASTASSDGPVYMLCSGGLLPDPCHHHA